VFSINPPLFLSANELHRSKDSEIDKMRGQQIFLSEARGASIGLNPEIDSKGDRGETL